MDVLLLRLDAPLMSFGGVMVDHHNPTDLFPGASLLTGLFANALGWAHGDADRLNALQERLIFAARWDFYPEALRDYHTVDLGTAHMREYGWTTRGEPEHRGGGEARYMTHVRFRDYWANGLMTVAVSLVDRRAPRIEALEAALRRPARPLFLGRKSCLPSAPILAGRMKARNVLMALKEMPRAQRTGRKVTASMRARWPADLDALHAEQLTSVYDRRDWRAQCHSGRRMVADGYLELPPNALG